MPSPFPGMDPYLESPDWFPDLHGTLIVMMKGMLQQALPETYYAQANQRVWLEYSQRYVEPDVEVFGPKTERRPQDRGGLAVATYQQRPPLVVSVEMVEHGPFRESFLEIRQRREKEVRLVASIEILSPSNKTIGNPGREKFLQKQREILESETHLIEIDLLRGGSHAIAVPREVVEQQASTFDYLVSIHRFDRPKEFLIHPFALSERLPEIAIPLLPGDGDVMVNLQALFDQSYDFGPYHREVAYGRDPIVPSLKPEQVEWVKALLAKTSPAI
jgi:Protein of unknown function (DUF4058)